MEVQVFSLVRKQVPIHIEDADGKVVEYMIRELDGRQRDKVISAHAKKITKNKDGSMKVDSLEGMYASLLAYTLYDPEGILVKFETIQSFPATVSESLYGIAAKLNNMAGKTEDKDDSKKD